VNKWSIGKIIIRKNEYSEYVCCVYDTQGRRRENADYYTDCKQDAIRTRGIMLRNAFNWGTDEPMLWVEPKVFGLGERVKYFSTTGEWFYGFIIAKDADYSMLVTRIGKRESITGVIIRQHGSDLERWEIN
jgi:hypothetical protein